MEIAFWISFVGVFYAYVGYPLVLMLIGVGYRSSRSIHRSESGSSPSISLLIPAHNEARLIARKIENSMSLRYPGELEVIVISDGSTDATSEVVNLFCDDDRLTFIELPERAGKASALNMGLKSSEGEIVVFSDASIILAENALCEIARPFADSKVGCVSGEDKIEGSEGEGLYGRYELFLRRQESKLGSIVGASGSFYAQRRELAEDFPEGMAPDFLSVLNTVQKGMRAISTSKAVGYMSAVSDTRNEFRRKTRTVIRGMTALFSRTSLLNPLRYPLFSFFLYSHKVIRWSVPFFLLILLIANCFLLDDLGYLVFLVAQLTFYVAAVAAYLDLSCVAKFSGVRVALYFVVSNAAILVAWTKYVRGTRQEIWNPSKRTL